MSRRSPLPLAVTCLLVALGATFGCHPQQPFYFHEDGDLSHYLDRATDIDYADVEEERLADVDGAISPFSLADGGQAPHDSWDLSLEETIHIALANSKVMKTIGGQVLGPPEVITRGPDQVATVYDPALTESNPRFGVEAALAAFDAQLSGNVFWEKTDLPQNVSPTVTFFRPTVLEQDLGSFQAQLSKTAATGGTWTVRHNVNYEWNNATASRAFPSDWRTSLEAEFRQPLMQGAGVMFNRIAGPGAIPGFNNGVMIARINTDIALNDFEANVRNLVSDVEVAYWDLYFAYRSLDALVSGRDSALETWRRIYTLYELQAIGGEGEKEAESRAQYFLFQTEVQKGLNSLYEIEAKLRYLMGIAATDGRLIRPADEPTVAKVTFDWYEAHREALCRNVELRRVRWRVKQRELELIAAKNYLRPRLDAVGRYRWNGLGDHLINANNNTGNPLDNAYESMTSGRYQDGQIGLEFSMPLGFRKEMSGVRYAQLNLARDRAILKEAELEVSHQLAQAIREVESYRVLAQSNFNRRVATTRQVEVMKAAYETGTVTIDRVLDAQRQLAQAESDYFGSVVAYNKAIVQVHLRKGTLLDYNGVQLSEGPWPGKAYFDAHRLARQRDASLYLDYGYTMPKVVSRGPVSPGLDGDMSLGEGFPSLEAIDPEGPIPTEAAPEVIPTPRPVEMPGEPPEPEPGIARRSSPADRVQPAAHTAPQAAGPAAAGPALIAPEIAPPRISAAQAGNTGWSSVQPAGYVEPAATRAARPAGSEQGWSSTSDPRGSQRTSPTPSTNSSAQSSSGWKSR